MSRCWSNLNKDSQVSMEGGGEALQSSTYSFGSSCSWAGVEVILIRTHRSVWKVGGKLCKVLLTVLAAVVHELWSLHQCECSTVNDTGGDTAASVSVNTISHTISITVPRTVSHKCECSTVNDTGGDTAASVSVNTVLHTISITVPQTVSHKCECSTVNDTDTATSVSVNTQYCIPSALMFHKHYHISVNAPQ